MKYLFIINPVAGKADASAALIPKIEAAAKELGVACEIIRTTHARHAAEIADVYAKSGEPVWLFACGGDGTLNELVQSAVGHSNVSIGCVPCGSGNDYVRNFGTKDDFLDISAQLRGSTATIDAIQTTYGYSVAICAAGLDAKVAYNIPRFRRLPGCGGTMAYTLSIIKVFFGKLGSEMEIMVDGQTLHGKYMMTAICNGRLYGGGYSAAPYAMMDDGLLDVVLVKKMPRIKIPTMLGVYKDGRHLTAEGAVIPALQPYMQTFHAKDVRLRVLDDQPLIVTLDGECAPRKELEARVVPQCLSIILPKTICARPKAVRPPCSVNA